jgi:hypothetical protein
MLEIQLHLPSCHGIIFPWDPPAFGIPLSVLSELADDLQQKVVDTAITLSKIEDKSRQSSPTNSDDDFEITDLSSIASHLDGIHVRFYVLISLRCSPKRAPEQFLALLNKRKSLNKPATS